MPKAFLLCKTKKKFDTDAASPKREMDSDSNSGQGGASPASPERPSDSERAPTLPDPRAANFPHLRMLGVMSIPAPYPAFSLPPSSAFTAVSRMPTITPAYPPASSPLEAASPLFPSGYLPVHYSGLGTPESLRPPAPRQYLHPAAGYGPFRPIQGGGDRPMAHADDSVPFETVLQNMRAALSRSARRQDRTQDLGKETSDAPGRTEGRERKSSGSMSPQGLRHEDQPRDENSLGSSSRDSPHGKTSPEDHNPTPVQGGHASKDGSPREPSLPSNTLSPPERRYADFSSPAFPLSPIPLGRRLFDFDRSVIDLRRVRDAGVGGGLGEGLGGGMGGSIGGGIGGSIGYNPFLAGMPLNSLGLRRPNSDKPPPVKKYKCDVCGKAFSRSNTLVTHKRIHTGDKPFACDRCGRAFRQPGNLTRHRLTHTSQKPYVCPTCNKAFNRASNLNTHIRTHATFRPFVCGVCHHTFPSKTDFRMHQAIHSGDKAHKCQDCGKAFSMATTLHAHRRSHHPHLVSPFLRHQDC